MSRESRSTFQNVQGASAEEIVSLNGLGSGKESNLVGAVKRVARNKITGAALIAASVFGAKSFSGSEKAYADGPQSLLQVNRIVDGGHPNPNYIPAVDSAFALQTGPVPVAPLTNAGNPNVTTTEVKSIQPLPAQEPHPVAPKPPAPPEQPAPPAPPAPPVSFAPPERTVQVETKKRIDANGNRVFDDGDLGISQDYIVWLDLNGNRLRDVGEPVQSTRTNPSGSNVVTFRGTNIGPGNVACSEETNVSSSLEVVVGLDCAPVDASGLAVNKLLNKNKQVAPPPTATPAPAQEVRVQPTPVYKAPAPAPNPLECTGPEAGIILPQEFRYSAADMKKLKCEEIAHDQRNTEQHNQIREDIQVHDQRNTDQHALLGQQALNLAAESAARDKALATAVTTASELSSDEHKDITADVKALRDGKVDLGVAKVKRDWLLFGALAGLGVAGLIGLRRGFRSLGRRLDNIGNAIQNHGHGPDGQPVVVPAVVVPQAPAQRGIFGRIADGWRRGWRAARGQNNNPEPQNVVPVAAAPAVVAEQPVLAQPEAPVVIPAVVVAEQPAQPGTLTQEQVNILAMVFENLERTFNQIDEMSDAQITRRLVIGFPTEELRNQFKQLLIQAVMALSQDDNEEELGRRSSSALIRRISARRRAINNQNDLLRIQQAREAMRAAAAQNPAA